jgi:hypothetical protein
MPGDINSLDMENLVANHVKILGADCKETGESSYADIFMMMPGKDKYSVISPHNDKADILKAALLNALETSKLTEEEYCEAVTITKKMKENKDCSFIEQTDKTLRAGDELSDDQLDRLDDIMIDRSAMQRLIAKINPFIMLSEKVQVV